VLAINEALTNLAKLDARQSTIVQLRFFAGLSIEDTAEVLGMSPATVKRDWITARAWLLEQMTVAAHDKGRGAASGQ
jgi:RNA polymerase sigma factor (sigma-70 family)